MALEPCPNCARRVSNQARFCVHCRHPILRTSGADLQFENFNHALQRFISILHHSGSTLKEFVPSTRLCLFCLLVLPLLMVAKEILLFSSISSVLGAVLIYALLMSPALLAFLLMLWRRPFGLYAAFPIFLWWFLALSGMIHLFSRHESSFLLFEWVILALISAWGVVTSFREAAGGSVLMRLLAFVIFFALETGKLWLFLAAGSS